MNCKTRDIDTTSGGHQRTSKNFSREILTLKDNRPSKGAGGMGEALDTNYNIKHAERKGYGKSGMHNEKTEEPGYRIEEMLRRCVAPLPRGRRIIPMFKLCESL